MSPTPNATQAAEQLRRLLQVLPTLADDQVHSLAEVAARVGASEDVVHRDLVLLMNRTGDEPGGFTEGVSLLMSEKTVQLQTLAGHFRRPMALTRRELHALELGLAMLAQELPPDERAPLHSARERLAKAIVATPNDLPPEEQARHATMGKETALAREVRRTLQACILERNVATIAYRSATRVDDDVRRVYPLGLVWSRGLWYCPAWCERSAGLRVFRCDRISRCTREAEHFKSIDGFALDDVLREGRVLIGEGGTPMRVRYSSRIARWIAEREGTKIEADGSTVVEHEAITEDWAVRQVLRYGPDAEVLSPPELQAAVAQRLRTQLD